MQSLLPHLPMMEASPSPPPPAPEPIPQRNAEALPLPPCFLELVKQQAERRLPSKACTPMLLQRANMLLQDAVDAASMCMRAHVDSPTLLKHVLGAEHYNMFLRDDDKVRALDLPVLTNMHTHVTTGKHTHATKIRMLIDMLPQMQAAQQASVKMDGSVERFSKVLSRNLWSGVTQGNTQKFSMEAVAMFLGNLIREKGGDQMIA